MPDSPPPPRPNPELAGLDTLDRAIERYWSLVLSVCRAQLADHHEAEDAAQETFIKLMRHRDRITGNVAAWLTATARTTAIDRVRAAIRQRERRERWVDSPARAAAEPRQALAEQAVRGLLPQALLELDPAAAQLLTERFVQDQPLRVLAGRRDVSVPTIGRRIAKGIDQLATVLTDMGVLGADTMPLTVYLTSLGEAGTEAGDWGRDYYQDSGLRHATHLPPAASENFPGWDRPLRVGLSLSHYNDHHHNRRGFNSSLALQARRSQWVDHPGIQLVGVIEPRTSHLGPIESTLRDYELNAGLIDITDTEALATLDVLIMPHRLFHIPRFIRPVLAAVRSGLGMLQEGHCGNFISGASGNDDPDLCAFKMARPPVEFYCTSIRNGSVVGHNLPVPATVLTAHPATPWLGRGQSISALSCCDLIDPADGVTVIAARDEPLQAVKNPRRPPLRTPVVLAGSIGRGRAVYLNMVLGDTVFGEPAVGHARLVDTLAWLAGTGKSS